MYGGALFIVVVLIVIYAFTCAFGWDVGKMSAKNNPITFVTSAVSRGVTLLVGSVASGTASGVEAGVADLDQPFSLTSNKTENDIDQLAELEGYAGQQNAIGGVSVYDPISMGAVKQKEVSAHYKNLKERSPFSTVGSIQPSRVKRDDDPYMRETGVPWVGGLPSRAFNRRVGGPQAGARDSISASSKSVEELYRSANEAPVWIG